MVFALIVLILAALVVIAPAMAAIEVEGDAYAGNYDTYLWRGLILVVASRLPRAVLI